jgi:hypothetical protein
MKKILFLFVASFALAFTSCTSDSDHGSAETSSVDSSKFQLKSSSGNAKLDSLYNVMVNSSDYISLQSQRENFIDKINFTGKTSDINTKPKLLSWINTNISITDFTNYTEAETELEQLSSASKTVMMNNLEFYKELQKEPSPATSLLLLTDPEYVTTDACGCGSTYSSALASIGADQAQSFENLVGSTDFSDLDSIDNFMAEADEMSNCYTASMSEAFDDYRVCLHNCNN